jgi:hypothetical protein
VNKCKPLVWGLPIERPKSVTTQWLEDKFGKV